MDQNLMESVLPIRIGNDNKMEFKGTGFIIYTSQNATYIITCWHVIEDFQGGEEINVGGFDAELFDSGEDSELDLAILKIPQRLDDNQGNKIPALKLCKSGNEEMRISIPGLKKQLEEQEVKRGIEGKLGSQIYYSSDKIKNISIPGWDLVIEEDVHLLEHGYSGSPVIDNETNYVLGITNIQEYGGKAGQAISVENIRHLEKFWQEIPPATRENIFKVPASHFRICIAVVAMTQEEAEQLDTGKVFGKHGEETEDFEQFKELKEVLGIEKLALQYGLSRDAWQPLGRKQRTIRQIIQNLVEKKINPNRSIEEKKVFIDYVSDLLIPQNNEIFVSVCDEFRNHGGIIVIDPISMYHPKIKKLLQRCQLLGSDNVISIIVTFPLTPKAYTIESLLEKYIYNSALETPFQHFEAFNKDYLGEFGVGSTYSLRRRVHDAILRIRDRDFLPTQEQIEAAFEGTGLDTGIGLRAVRGKHS